MDARIRPPQLEREPVSDNDNESDLDQAMRLAFETLLMVFPNARIDLIVIPLDPAVCDRRALMVSNLTPMERIGLYSELRDNLQAATGH